MRPGWIGVDLDGTLAEHLNLFIDGIGPPIPRMVERVKGWLAQGIEVRIVTARASVPDEESLDEQVRMITGWCLKHLGVGLPITCSKDLDMIELWDDRAVQVIQNTGQRADGLL